MTKYAVDITETTVYRLIVEAVSEDAAEEKAENAYMNNDADPEQAGFRLIDSERDTFAREEE